jgi:uncharacterized protein YktA (UPF0223 family)
MQKEKKSTLLIIIVIHNANSVWGLYDKKIDNHVIEFSYKQEKILN